MGRQATPGWSYGFGYSCTAFRDCSSQQSNMTADCFLSTHTDVYAQVSGQWVDGTAQRTDTISLNGSTTRKQLRFRIGM